MKTTKIITLEEAIINKLNKDGLVKRDIQETIRNLKRKDGHRTLRAIWAADHTNVSCNTMRRLEALIYTHTVRHIVKSSLEVA